jgi:hypothetical protein
MRRTKPSKLTNLRCLPCTGNVGEYSQRISYWIRNSAGYHHRDNSIQRTSLQVWAQHLESRLLIAPFRRRNGRNGAHCDPGAVTKQKESKTTPRNDSIDSGEKCSKRIALGLTQKGSPRPPISIQRNVHCTTQSQRRHFGCISRERAHCECRDFWIVRFEPEQAKKLSVFVGQMDGPAFRKIETARKEMFQISLFLGLQLRDRQIGSKKTTTRGERNVAANTAYSYRVHGRMNRRSVS